MGHHRHGGGQQVAGYPDIHGVSPKNVSGAKKDPSKPVDRHGVRVYPFLASGFKKSHKKA
jgi:hypothetical protein